MLQRTDLNQSTSKHPSATYFVKVARFPRLTAISDGDYHHTDSATTPRLRGGYLPRCC